MILHVPREFRDTVVLPKSLKDAKQAFKRYREFTAKGNPVELVWPDFQKVWGYCEEFGDPVLEFLSKNKVQGYSLFIHEVFELKWYFDNGSDPFTRRHGILEDFPMPLNFAAGFLSQSHTTN